MLGSARKTKSHRHLDCRLHSNILPRSRLSFLCLSVALRTAFDSLIGQADGREPCPSFSSGQDMDDHADTSARRNGRRRSDSDSDRQDRPSQSKRQKEAHVRTRVSRACDRCKTYVFRVSHFPPLCQAISYIRRAGGKLGARASGLASSAPSSSSSASSLRRIGGAKSPLSTSMTVRKCTWRAEPPDRVRAPGPVRGRSQMQLSSGRRPHPTA